MNNWWSNMKQKKICTQSTLNRTPNQLKWRKWGCKSHSVWVCASSSSSSHSRLTKSGFTIKGVYGIVERKNIVPSTKVIVITIPKFCNQSVCRQPKITSLNQFNQCALSLSIYIWIDWKCIQIKKLPGESKHWTHHIHRIENVQTKSHVYCNGQCMLVSSSCMLEKIQTLKDTHRKREIVMIESMSWNTYFHFCFNTFRAVHTSSMYG